MEHDWFGFLLPFVQDREYRSVQWILACGRLLHIIFIQTVLSELYYADDGTCQKHESESSCLDPRGLDHVNHICIWSSSRGCSFNSDAADSALSVLIILAIVTSLAVPLDAIFRVMVLAVRDFARVSVTSNKIFIESSVKMTSKRVSNVLRQLESKRGRFFRAAKLVKLQADIKDKSLDEELAALLVDVHAQQKKMMSSVLFGDFPREAGLLKERLQAADESGQKKILAKLLSRARREETEILALLDEQRSEDEQDMFLLRHFLLGCLPLAEATIARRYFFEDQGGALARTVSLLAAPLYVFFLVFYVLYFGPGIGSQATNIWLIGVFGSYLLSTVVLQPARVWAQFTFLASFASELSLWHQLLFQRLVSLIKRGSGRLSTDTAWIQVRILLVLT